MTWTLRIPESPSPTPSKELAPLFPELGQYEHGFGSLVAVDYRLWPTGIQHFPDHPHYRSELSSMNPARQASYLAGRQALSQALKSQGLEGDQIRTGERGEPVLPRDCAGSITHKSGIALAIARSKAVPTLGIDLESQSPSRLHLARRILTPTELRALDRLPQTDRWTFLATVFSFKEALYKALHPHLGRYIGFQEVALESFGSGWKSHFAFEGGSRFRADLEALDLPEAFRLTLVRVWVDAEAAPS